MKLNVLRAKVKRNNFVGYAGEYFVDETSEIIKKLNAEGKRALLGIQNRKGVYTVVGERFVYYKTSSGKSEKISLKAFSEELHYNSCRIGKGYLKIKFMYNNIVLSNDDKVWLQNSDTMFSLWNTILWLEELPANKVDGSTPSSSALSWENPRPKIDMALVIKLFGK